MNTIRGNVGLRSVTIVLVLLFMGALGALCGPAHAQTWGRLYRGPWDGWWTGTAFHGTLPTSDGGYLLTGTSNNRGVILKVSSDGTPEWTTLIKGNGYQQDTTMISAVEASNGDFIATGQVFANTTTYPEAGAGSWDIYVIRLTPTGSTVWDKLYGRKNVGTVPDTNEFPQHIYESCPEGGGACKYVVTGFVIYSGVLDCIYSGYRASQALVIDGQGAVQDDFLMGGPAALGNGAVETVYTRDGEYLVLTELCNPPACYTIGLQKYGPTGARLWSKAYYEIYPKDGIDHFLKITAGKVVETNDGYVLAGHTYNNVEATSLGAYYHFKVNKATGSTVAWNKKYQVWPGWNSAWVDQFVTTPDGGLLARISDGVSTANDRILKTSQSNGNLIWGNEYGEAALGAIAPGIGDLAVTNTAWAAVLARLSGDGQMDESCKAIPISDKTSEITGHPISRTAVYEGLSESGCNEGVGPVAAYEADLIDAGEYTQYNICAPLGEVSADWNGIFGTRDIGSSYDIAVRLSNYNGLSNLNVRRVRLSDTTNFKIVPGTNTCSKKTLYPGNVDEPTSCSVTVRFSPVTYGAKKCIVRFASNSDTPLKQALQGTGAGGAVKVTIDPRAARTAGAMWRVDDKPWQKSGARVYLPAGSHVLSFKRVTGWKKPANKTVDVVNDQILPVKGAYKKITVE